MGTQAEKFVQQVIKAVKEKEPENTRATSIRLSIEEFAEYDGLAYALSMSRHRLMRNLLHIGFKEVVASLPPEHHEIYETYSDGYLQKYEQEAK